MLLLITGCVNVSDDTPYVTVRNENDRLKQYLSTIEWALKSTCFDIIVFCENSNCQFDFINYALQIKKDSRKQFEHLAFQGDISICNQKGKGYGEGEIIKYAYRNSRFMRHETHFYKITGKLIIENIDALLATLTENCFMNCCDLAGKVDTKFYKLCIVDYESALMEAYEDVNDRAEIHLENVIYRKLKQNKIRYSSFPCVPIIKGVSGTTGKIYKRMSERKQRLYDAFCRFGFYNWRVMAFVDYILVKIHY